MCDRGVLTVVRCLLIATPIMQVTLAVADENSHRVDPAAWGADHVGQPLPEYMTGDECMFCHRDLGTTWNDLRHQLTIRMPTPEDDGLRFLRAQQGDDLAAEVQLLMGSKRITRFLRRSQQYGKLEIFSASFHPSQDKAGESAGNRETEQDHWDATTELRRLNCDD